MKTNFVVLAFAIFIPGSAFCQDSTLARANNKVTFRNDAQIHSTILPAEKTNITPSTYYDTRQGSSSPMYNTYQKNDYGAGAVTNNPNKGQSGSPIYIPAVADSTRH